jgi:hypothetical protein
VFRAVEISSNFAWGTHILLKLLIPADQVIGKDATDGAAAIRVCHAAIAERSASAVIPPARIRGFC